MPAPAEARDDFLVYLDKLAQLHRRAQLQAGLGWSWGGLDVLRTAYLAAGQGRPHDFTSLASELDTTSQSAGRAVAELERAGLLEVERSGRRCLIWPTQPGIDLLDGLAKRGIAAAHKYIAAPLSL